MFESLFSELKTDSAFENIALCHDRDFPFFDQKRWTKDAREMVNMSLASSLASLAHLFHIFCIVIYRDLFLLSEI